MKNLFWIAFCLAPFQVIVAQNTFKLINPSFEANVPSTGITPKDWVNIGIESETPPDIQPGQFGVYLPAQDGRCYLGLVVRDNSTWEGVGQELKGFLKKDSSYTFSLYLARSEQYKSPTKTSPNMMLFNAPTILRIWGYNTTTQKEELLAETLAIGSSDWTLYDFVLKPTQGDFNELDLSAYYAPGYEKKNGSLLIDNCSPIVRVTK